MPGCRVSLRLSQYPWGVGFHCSEVKVQMSWMQFGQFISRGVFGLIFLPIKSWPSINGVSTSFYCPPTEKRFPRQCVVPNGHHQAALIGFASYGLVQFCMLDHCLIHYNPFGLCSYTGFASQRALHPTRGKMIQWQLIRDRVSPALCWWWLCDIEQDWISYHVLFI